MGQHGIRTDFYSSPGYPCRRHNALLVALVLIIVLPVLPVLPVLLVLSLFLSPSLSPCPTHHEKKKNKTKKKNRFERGNIDEVTIEAPALGLPAALWVAPESGGEWFLEEVELSCSEAGTSTHWSKSLVQFISQLIGPIHPPHHTVIRRRRLHSTPRFIGRASLTTKVRR